MIKPSVLIVGSDRDLTGMLAQALSQTSAVERTEKLQTAASMLRYDRFSALIVDLSPNPVQEMQFLRTIRRSRYDGPIIVLCGHVRRDMAALCYEAGADTFVPKGGETMREVKAIVGRIIARRTRRTRVDGIVLPQDAFQFGGAEVDPKTMTVRFSRGQETELTPKLVGILSVLARGRGSVVRRTEIIEEVWGQTGNPSGKAVNVYLVRLRRIFRDGGIDLNNIIRPYSKVGWLVKQDAA